jgi:polar amino acid transport system substrate-binding protein
MSNNRTLLIIVGLLAVVALVLCGFLGFVFFLQPAPPEPTPTAPVVQADDSWEKVRAAGKIVVGTSADYLPFEYYVAESQLDGFDIALMNEIGRRMGVPPEYHNIAFDGLGNALQLKQIDTAIAAISMTPERAAVVDFSNIYLVSEDAILAAPQAQVTISQPQDMAGFRIGVQSGSVHARWAQTNLVDTGIIPPDNLFVYQVFAQAVSDLLAKRLDLLITDLPAAQAAAQANTLTIVGQGLNPQRYALALPKGSAALKAEIDRILADLQSEGKVAELAKQYLDLDPAEILPIPTPGPEATAPAPPATGCLDGLALVEHLSMDDKNMTAPPQLAPGQPFTKGWRVRNVGTCTWDQNYRLVYAHGNNPAARMGGEPVALTQSVAPNETYDLEINLIAPLKPGVYQGFWQMVNGQNLAFGERLPVGISVTAPATATPAPTQTPAPGIDFRVDRTNIKQGECVVFSWKVENVREVYFYAQGEQWQDKGVAGEGSQTVCPTTTTIYELRVVKTDGSVEVRQIVIYVEPVVGAPAITRFSVDPEPQITVGQCVEIRWEVQGEVNNVKLTANNTALWDGAPTKGSLENCPPGTGNVDYALEATGPGGSSRQQRTIKVVAVTETPVPPTSTAQPPTSEPPTPVPPTPAPDAPVINAFEVQPNQVETGSCVNVSWRTGGGVARVQLKRDGAVVLDNAPFEGAEQDCSLAQPGTVMYGIEAFNSANEPVSAEESVTVSDAAPENPLAGTSWALQEALEGTTITASFGGDGSLNGSAGCNSYSAQYIVSGQSLAITPPDSTQSLCAEPVGIMEQEDTYLSALSAAGSFRIEGGILVIQDSAGNPIMQFNKL